MHSSDQELADIRGLLHTMKKLPLEERSKKLLEVTTRIAKLIIDFERRRKRHLEPLHHALIVLLGSLENGRAAIPIVVDLKAYNWALERIEYYVTHWHAL